MFASHDPDEAGFIAWTPPIRATEPQQAEGFRQPPFRGFCAGHSIPKGCCLAVSWANPLDQLPFPSFGILGMLDGGRVIERTLQSP
jgi:hypothetical protein